MSDPSVSDVTPIVKTITIVDVPCEVCKITSRCWTLTSLKTGKVAQFKSQAALDTFIGGLTWYIAHKRLMATQEAA